MSKKVIFSIVGAVVLAATCAVSVVAVVRRKKQYGW